MSANEELELGDFCETSSWETTSVLSEEDSNVNVRKAVHKPHQGGLHEEREESSSESELSEKWPQERWEENECHKFNSKYKDL